MAVPKRKTSRTKTRTRRTHKKLKLVALEFCKQCSEMKRAGIICPSCGYYRGKKILEIEE